MVCPNCKSDLVNVQVVSEVVEKNQHSVLYWVLVGWWLEFFLWVYFFIPRLIVWLISGGRKRIGSETHSIAVCQNCGYNWKLYTDDSRVTGSEPRLSGTGAGAVMTEVEKREQRELEPFYHKAWFWGAVAVVIFIVFRLAYELIYFG